MRIKLDRTVCDGFGTCAAHAPQLFSLDDWGYPSLVGTGEVDPTQEDAARRALLDCPAHAIVDLGARRLMPSGGEAGVARSVGAAGSQDDRGDKGEGAPW